MIGSSAAVEHTARVGRAPSLQVPGALAIGEAAQPALAVDAPMPGRWVGLAGRLGPVGLLAQVDDRAPRCGVEQRLLRSRVDGRRIGDRLGLCTLETRPAALPPRWRAADGAAWRSPTRCARRPPSFRTCGPCTRPPTDRQHAPTFGPPRAVRPRVSWRRPRTARSRRTRPTGPAHQAAARRRVPAGPGGSAAPLPGRLPAATRRPRTCVRC
jgi:hypothetical protein